MIIDELAENPANAMCAAIVAIIFAYLGYNAVPDGSFNFLHLLGGFVGFFIGYIVGLFALGLLGIAIGLGLLVGGGYLFFFVCIPWLFDRS